MAQLINMPMKVKGREALFEMGLGIEQVAQRVMGIYRRALGKQPVDSESGSSAMARYQEER